MGTEAFMSVHGEYSRALENLIACLRALDPADAKGWIRRLERVRIEGHPDLSSAARVGFDMRVPPRGLHGELTKSPRSLRTPHAPLSTHLESANKLPRSAPAGKLGWSIHGRMGALRCLIADASRNFRIQSHARLTRLRSPQRC